MNLQHLLMAPNLSQRSPENTILINFATGKTIPISSEIRGGWLAINDRRYTSRLPKESFGCCPPGGRRNQIKNCRWPIQLLKGPVRFLVNGRQPQTTQLLSPWETLTSSFFLSRFAYQRSLRGSK